MISGILVSEKNVPQRKVIGNITRLLKVLISLCDFAKNDMKTPRKEKTKQERIRAITRSGLMLIEGESAKPTSRKAAEVNKPLTTPIKALPMIIE
jgi:hypothetical protein